MLMLCHVKGGVAIAALFSAVAHGLKKAVVYGDTYITDKNYFLLRVTIET